MTVFFVFFRKKASYLKEFDEFLKVLHEHIAQNLHSKLSLGGLLITLGIIYGDIGTSPCNAILGESILLRMLFWGIPVFGPTLQTTIKYVIIFECR
jgi:K+ transporter